MASETEHTAAVTLAEQDAEILAENDDDDDTEMTAAEMLAKQDVVHKLLLECVDDIDSYMSKLRGTPHIVDRIWQLYRAPYYWTSLIKLPCDFDYYDDRPEELEHESEVAVETDFLKELNEVEFPSPKDITINMMPFIMAYDFEDTKLPDYLQEYWNNLIDNHVWNLSSEIGKICYISIHESKVADNKSQRRPGLHTETPGKVNLPADEMTNKGAGTSQMVWYHWGCGNIMDRTEIIGGIYMASNVANSCKVWNCKIMRDSNGDEIIDKLGDIEHLRRLLPEGEIMEENMLYWISDRTPHESLPLPKGTYRQWFRLVTSEVSLWFEDHSTKNPNGVVPDPKITKILRGSKFQKDTLQVVNSEDICQNMAAMSVNT